MYYSLDNIKIQDVPRPKIKSDEVLVEMKACGVCGSDLMEWYLRSRAPLVLGHEPAGVLVEAGEDVTVYFFSPTCPHCVRTTPVVAPLAKDMDVDLVQYNLLEFEQGWNDYGIESTPTIVQYKDGKEVNRIVGYQEEATFKDWFNEYTLK